MDIIYTVHIKEIDLVYSTHSIDNLFDYIQNNLDEYTDYSDMKIYAFTDNHIVYDDVYEFKNKTRKELKKDVDVISKLEYMIRCTDRCGITCFGNTINDCLFDFNLILNDDIEFFTTIEPCVLNNSYRSINLGTLVEYGGGKYIIMNNLDDIVDNVFQNDSYDLEGCDKARRYQYYGYEDSQVIDRDLTICENQELEKDSFLYYMREVALSKRRWPTTEEFMALENCDIESNSWRTLDWATNKALL